MRTVCFVMIPEYLFICIRHIISLGKVRWNLCMKLSEGVVAKSSKPLVIEDPSWIPGVQ